ncbi:MAG: hypothetical protein J3K34DRAFT_464345 [Monoraphidium minutum]|nr:MAG: hypothetical protein J3K34DRAFT_464345 [Monoraphidium minutum]
MRELPRPADVQQTLVQSFTIGGMGLHSGEYAVVRVRPAYAGDGRYFVRVPKGTNSDRFVLDDDEQIVDEEDLPEAMADPYDTEGDRIRVELYTQYLAAQEDDFEGTFSDFLLTLDSAPLSDLERRVLSDALAAARAEAGAGDGGEGEEGEEGEEGGGLFPDEEELEPEEIQEADPNAEVIVPANILSAVADEDIPFITLLPLDAIAGEGEDAAAAGAAHAVINPTLLLAALECCGIDNARIEIEGGQEVPVLDNSSLGWALNIQQAGVREAPILGAPPLPWPSSSGGGDDDEEEEEREQPTRMVLMPPEPVSVQRGDAFVSFYPGNWSKVSAGVDVQDASAVIGQQWYSWRVSRDYHFRYELAPARGWVESVDRLFELRARGFIKAGGENMFIIGHAERWWDPQAVRFHQDEPARHQLLQLLGALSLLGAGGNSGIPIGHVVAHNADAELMVDFARAFAAACEDADAALVDTADLYQAQLGLLEEEAAARDALGAARKARAAALSGMGGPVAGGGAGGRVDKEEGEEEEGEEEEGRQ